VKEPAQIYFKDGEPAVRGPKVARVNS